MLSKKMKGPTILWAPYGRTRPTSKPPRSRRRWSITRCSMSEQPRIDTEHQGSKVLPVVGQLETAIREMSSHQLDRPALRRPDPQSDLLVEIPQGSGQPILLRLIRSAQRYKKRPVLTREQLESARERERPIGIGEMHIPMESGVVEILSLGEAERGEFPAIVIERENEWRDDSV